MKRERGRIVNVTSVVGQVCLPYLSIYGMSKFAVEAFSDCLRMEMMPFNVSVHIIEPTMCKTNMTDSDMVSNSIKKCWDQIDEDTRKEYGETFLKGSKCPS